MKPALRNQPEFPHLLAHHWQPDGVSAWCAISEALPRLSLCGGALSSPGPGVSPQLAGPQKAQPPAAWRRGCSSASVQLGHFP